MSFFSPSLALIEIFHHAQVFLDACKGVFFQASVFMDAITPIWVQTLIETLCNLVLDFADNNAFWCIFLTCLISNFSLNISLVSFMFAKSGNRIDSALWKGENVSTVSTNLCNSLHSLTFLAKGSVQKPTKHKQLLAENANTFL